MAENRQSPPLAEDMLKCNFSELLPPLTQAEALAEAHRCLYCYDAPCTKACPTVIDVPAFIKKITTGNLKGAGRVILSANFLGATCARVCPVDELCEGASVLRTDGSEAVRIGRLQRYVTDYVMDNNIRLFQPAQATGKKVACVGGGPASLSCAAELARLGYAITVFEKRELAGGLDAYAIPAFREPPSVSLKEVEMVQTLGVEIRTGIEVGKDVEVAVTVRRLGAEQVTLVYRRSAAEMTAYRAEFEFAKQEGCEYRWLTLPVRILGQERVTGVECLRTRLGKPSEDGRRRPEPVPGTEHVIECDQVILATGQSGYADFLDKLGIENDRGRVIVDRATGRTSHPRIFASGDRALFVSAMVASNREAWHKVVKQIADTGADALSLINTVTSIVGVNLDTLETEPSVHGRGTPGGYAGPPVKPISLYMVTKISKENLKVPISGIGGIETWRDAAEYILLGATSVQVCTGIMKYGFRIVEDMIDGLANWMDEKGFARISDFVGKAASQVGTFGELDIMYRTVAEIDYFRCVYCKRYYIACEDGLHQAIELVQRGSRAEPHIKEDECVGCRMCELIRPTHCIRMVERDPGFGAQTWLEIVAANPGIDSDWKVMRKWRKKHNWHTR